MSAQRELDLVFVCDCTGSMGGYIHSAQQNINAIVEGIMKEEKCDVRFALIEYRDHPPQDNSFVTYVHEFTTSVSRMKQYVDHMAASGGGDGPECSTCGLNKALHMPYRKTAAKVVVLISDAPPHGLERGSDGFPNGCPDGLDPIEIARSMAEAGIVVYTVAVEPNISSYMYARDFMRAVAKITGGQCLALTDAALLTKVIIGGAAEQLTLETLVEQVATEARQLQMQSAGAAPVSEEEIAQKVAEKLQAAKVQTVQVQIDDIYQGRYDMTNVAALENAPRLSAACLKPLAQPSPPASFAPPGSSACAPPSSMPVLTCESSAPMPSMPYAASIADSPGSMPAPPASTPAQKAEYSRGTVATEQVSRIMKQAKSRGLY